MALKEDSVLHYNLGKLAYFSSKKLFSDPTRKDQDDFILSLSLAHNDFKALLFFWEVVGEFPPKSPNNGYVSARFGQYSSYRWMLYRYLAGALNEVLVLLEKKKEVLEDSEIARAMAKLDTSYQHTWEQLKSLARNIVDERDEETKQLRNKISNVRDNISFHYCDNSHLSDNYKKAFFNSTIRPDGRAYFTNGSSLEQISFLFADAAVETFLIEKMGMTPSNPDTDPLRKFVKAAYISIGQLVLQYLKQVQADVVTLGPSDREYEVGEPVS
ncbi:hypothetical protein ACLWBD_00490 [Bdellovibrio sp. HCB117]|uniref:hypothetical protein n=1 Tax=Bdellovibrio sp. HCB117 TaxID=3394359 RepID=UPI0039B48963